MFSHNNFSRSKFPPGAHKPKKNELATLGAHPLEWMNGMEETPSTHSPTLENPPAQQSQGRVKRIHDCEPQRWVEGGGKEGGLDVTGQGCTSLGRTGFLETNPSGV